MKKSYWTVCFVVLFFGCGTTDKQRDAIHDYKSCVDQQAREIDDGISDAGDIATAAMYSCSKYENIAIPYTGELRRETEKILREQGYAVGVKAVSENRKTKSRGATEDCQFMYGLIEDCHEAGVGAASSDDCAQYGFEIRKIFRDKYPGEAGWATEMQEICQLTCDSASSGGEKPTFASICL